MAILAMKVASAAAHPNADALRVYTMDDGAGNAVQIVANLETVYEPGDVLAVALVGTVLADGTEIKKAKLRGVLSFGMALGKTSEPVGTALTERFGATEAGAPVDESQGVAEESQWPRYTSIESYLKFREQLLAADEVVVTEKLHGSNFRFGFHGNEDSLFGTHTSRVVRGREDPDTWPRGHIVEKMLRWARETGVRERLEAYRAAHPEVRSLAVYGEVHGAKCADLQYGMSESRVRLFGEVNRDGRWLDYDEALKLVAGLFPDVDPERLLVPVLHRGRPEHELLHRLRDQPSRLAASYGVGQLSEGVVIRPTREIFNEALKDRLILKYKSPLYEERASLRNADPEALPRYATVYDLLQDFVTEERLRHVLGKAAASGVPVHPKSRDTLVRMLHEDILKEAAGEWPEDAALDPKIVFGMTKKLAGEMLHDLLRQEPAR
jgi:tRNA-binding EMAP/Myf-like protein